jgi:hypothetical protein
LGKISIQRRVPCGSVRKFTYLRISSKSQPNDEGQKTGGDYSNCDARHLGKPLPNQQIGFGLLRRGVFPARDTSSYCRFAIIKIVRVRWNLAGPVFSGLLNQAFHPELMRI